LARISVPTPSRRSSSGWQQNARETRGKRKKKLRINYFSVESLGQAKDATQSFVDGTKLSLMLLVFFFSYK
jgi:hypothetical protein